MLNLEARCDAACVVLRGDPQLRQVFLVNVRARVGGQLVAVSHVVAEQLSELGLDDHLIFLEVPLPNTDFAGGAREPEPVRRFGQHEPVSAPADRLNQESHDQGELDCGEHRAA